MKVILSTFDEKEYRMKDTHIEMEHTKMTESQKTVIEKAQLAISELCRQQALYGTEEKYNKLYKLRIDLKDYEEKYDALLIFVKEVARFDFPENEYKAGIAENIGTFKSAYFARELLTELGEL